MSHFGIKVQNLIFFDVFKKDLIFFLAGRELDSSFLKLTCSKKNIMELATKHNSMINLK